MRLLTWPIPEKGDQYKPTVLVQTGPKLQKLLIGERIPNPCTEEGDSWIHFPWFRKDGEMVGISEKVLRISNGFILEIIAEWEESSSN